MAFFEGADLIVVIGAIGAAAATVVGAWLAHRRPPDATEDRGPEQAIVQLHPDDRELLLKIKDALFRCATRLEDAALQLRRAIDDNSDHLKRGRKD